MPWYCSFLIFSPTEIETVQEICRSAGWKSNFILDPSRRYRFSGHRYSYASHPESSIARTALKANEEFGKLLVLEGEENDVENIVNLIRSSMIVLSAFQHDEDNYVGVIEMPEDSRNRYLMARNIFRSSGYYSYFTYQREMPTAVALAGAAWGNKSNIYAIHKLASSIRTECVTPDSMHPRHGAIFSKHTDSHIQHVGTSTAINLAFSAIQELGLDVKASAVAPRWVDRKSFEWNPLVLDNLQKRLQAAGIRSDEKFEWIFRGPPTEVEVHPVRDIPSQYSDGQRVRDVEYTFPDAINACEYLRNFMTAHAFRDNTMRLGPYEVFNVQQVARQLILTKLGLWKVWTKDLKRRYEKV